MSCNIYVQFNVDYERGRQIKPEPETAAILPPVSKLKLS